MHAPPPPPLIPTTPPLTLPPSPTLQPPPQVTNFINEGQGDAGDEKDLEATIERLTGEANEAVEAKREQEQELKALKKVRIGRQFP